jgi:hypothetical protein
MTQNTFILLSALVVFSGYFIIQRKLKLSAETPIYKHINRLHRVGEITIIVISLLVLFFVWVVFELRPSHIHDLFLVLAIVSLFRTMMELRFRKDSKQYILSAYSSVSSLLIFLGVELIF